MQFCFEENEKVTLKEDSSVTIISSSSKSDNAVALKFIYATADIPGAMIPVSSLGNLIFETENCGLIENIQASSN